MVVIPTAKRYDQLIRSIRICSLICGTDVLNPKFRITILTLIVFLIINLIISCTFYTLYVGIWVERDWTKPLQTLCMIGSVAQGYCKMVNAVWYQRDHRFLVEEVRVIYEEYEKKHAEYQLYLKKSITRVLTSIKTMGAVYIIAVSELVLLVPWYFFIHDTRIFVMQFILPGVDPETDFGYYVTNFVHISCVAFGAFGNFAADTLFVSHISHIPLLKDILRCKFHDLNKVLEDDDLDNSNEVRDMLKDIFQWHQKYISNIGMIKATYFWMVLVQVVTGGLSILCTLFCLILGSWIGGDCYLMYCFAILYLYCGLGTLVEISNDDVITACYNDVLWYKLTIAEQKMLQRMLMTAQNTTGITVGSILPLSMNTGLQLSKTIYTSTMMLVNFIDLKPCVR
ncbi:odorant receptor 67d-like [Haematobia irritans]|uniref:odorant receptor 67d-like n=1 Tax=Haematobia irritans TaxID=7368 RepID=UPI003F4F6D00